MAKDTTTIEADGEKKKGGTVKLFAGALVLIVVGALAGKMLLAGGDDDAAMMDPASTTTTTEPPGPVTTLNSITLNLADGRFLKVGLAFEIHADADYPHESDMDDQITAGFAREVDAAIMLLSSYTYSDLTAPGGRQAAKDALLTEVKAVSDDAVKDIFFHEFVMQ